jgi:hypothetical protein
VETLHSCGNGKMGSHLLKKIAQKFSRGLKTPHLYFVVLHDIMVGIIMLVSVLSCMQLVYICQTKKEKILDNLNLVTQYFVPFAICLYLPNKEVGDSHKYKQVVFSSAIPDVKN